MKYIKILLLILSIFFLTGTTNTFVHNVTLYPAEKKDETLHPIHEKIYAKNRPDLAKKIIDKLYEIQYKNNNIVLIEDKPKIKISENCATIDFSSEDIFSDNYEKKLLKIYSLVNSLTSCGDIITVKFTYEGKTINVSNDIDLSETFVPDYNICS